MKRFTLPRSGKKSGFKTFGVPLKEIIEKEQLDIAVPFIVQKCVAFLYTNGLDCEGIFRINSSTRVVENLRNEFDSRGDADFEDIGDVMAAAGLLKLYLRELPDPCIPSRMHFDFVNAQEDYLNHSKQLNSKLKSLIQELPLQNRTLLCYLCQFLNEVANNEYMNKMNTTALGIVFGPNLFRVSSGIEGLREQGITNQIVKRLLDNYLYFFQDEPKFLFAESAQAPPNVVMVKPAKESNGKLLAKEEKVVSSDSDNGEITHAQPLTNTLQFDSPAMLHAGPAELDRSPSPFALDEVTMTEESLVISPENTLNSSILNNCIQECVSERLFGEVGDSFSDELLKEYDQRKSFVETPQTDFDGLFAEAPLPSLTSQRPQPPANRKSPSRKMFRKHPSLEDELDGQPRMETVMNDAARLSPTVPSTNSQFHRGTPVRYKQKTILAKSTDQDNGSDRNRTLDRENVPPSLSPPDRSPRLGEKRLYQNQSSASRTVSNEVVSALDYKTLQDAPPGSHFAPLTVTIPAGDMDAAPSPPHPTSCPEAAHRATVVREELTRKLQTLKRKVKQFDAQFERENGRKPSQADRNHNLEVKRLNEKLTRTRNQLKGPLISPVVTNDQPAKPEVAVLSEPNRLLINAVEQAQLSLMNKRTDVGRPENLNLMTSPQISYRAVKRMVALQEAMESTIDDLQPISEDRQVEQFQQRTAMDDTGLPSDRLPSPDRNTPLSSDLHIVTIVELTRQHSEAKLEKKRLRKLLRNFEEEYMERSGKKIAKEDRTPFAAQYREYKELKGKLRLLEALITKQGGV